jgi:hypothetical protein
MIKKRIICAVLVLLALLALLYFATLLFVPKYVSQSREGNLVAEYYDEIEARNSHQVLFVGDCEVYESFVPAKLWEEYGITSYIRGSAQQLIWQSYYLLEEMLEYETPEVVVFNVLAMKYGEPQNEAYNRMSIDGMKWSKSKVGAINASMTEDETFVSYAFPLLRFHSRWKEVSAEDFEYLFTRDKVAHNGYMIQTGIKPMESNSKGGELMDYTLPASAFDYLNKMRELCDEKGVELVLVKSPTNTWKYWWYDEWDAQISSYAQKHGLDYYNFINNEEIGIDWSQDTYDGGVHLNVWGAEKMTKYFGKILAENYGIESLKGDAPVSKIWREKTELYEAEKNNGGQ